VVDNVTLNAGSGGDVIATEDIGGVEYQQVKLVDGTATSTTAIPLSGDLANGLDVDVTRVGGTVTVDGSGVTQPVSAAALPLPSGAATAAAQLPDGHNVTVDNASIAVTNAGLTELAAAINVSSQMDVNLAASAATVTVDLGANNDVTVTGTVDLGATDNAVLDSIDTAVNGTLAVDLGANNDVTVTGTVDLGATDNAVLDSIVTNTTGLAGCVSGSELQVDIVSGGTGSTQYAEDSVHSSGDTGTMILGVRQDTQADFGADGDYVPASIDANGAIRVNAINADGTSNIDTAAGATDAGAVMLAIRDDALTTLTPVDGDYVGLRVNSTGSLHVTGAGGGTQYNISDVVGGTDTVTMAGVVRDDALTTLTEADGDVSILRVNSTGALHVTGGGGGTEYTQDAAATDPATAATTLIVRDDALSTQETTDGDWTVPRANARGAQWVELDLTNDVTIADGGNSITVDGTVTETNSAAILADTASMDTNLGTLAGAVTGTEMQVDVVAALPAGTNNIGDVDIASSVALDVSAATVTVDLGANNDVTVTGTVDLGATDNAVLDTIETNTDFGTVVGGGVEATALRVTLANDSTGVLSVDDGGGTLTVDGTVTANLSATDNAVLDSIDSAVSGTLTVGSHAVTNAGTFATQVDGDALTALQLIDNPIVAHDAAASGSTGVDMVGAIATNSVEGITQVANADATRVAADLNGVLLTRNATTLEELVSTSQTVTATTSTAATNFGAGGAGIHNYVTSVTIYNSSATDTFVRLQAGSGGADIWVLPAPATGGTTMNFDPPLRQNTANQALYFAAGAAVTTMYVSIAGFAAQG